jgi:cold shock protein
MKGTIKWYRKEKGYGFISGDDNKEYFMHYTSLPQDIDNVDGKTVEFEIKNTDRGTQAVDIKFSEEDSDDESDEDLKEE